MTVRIFAVATVVLLGCTEPEAPAQSPPDPVPQHYAFASRFGEGSSVGYSGQALRHVLISDLASRIGGLTDRIDSETLVAEPGQVRDELLFYYDFDAAAGDDVSHGITTDPAPKQTTYGAVSSGKKLKDKVAGNAQGAHKDWSTAFVGWGATGSTTPEGRLLQWIDALDTLAVERSNGTIPLDPAGQPIGKVHVTSAGLDLKELIQKFLLGTVVYAQATDWYLDEELGSSDERDGDKPYSKLEHAWDEAFGYFGAARDYTDYTDEEVAGAGGRDGYNHGYHDSDGDGAIDLAAEHNFGHAVTAAKRDLGSAATAPTDFSASAFSAFRQGRLVIALGDNLNQPASPEDLRPFAEQAARAWEDTIAATVVHYINEVLGDMAAFDGADYAFLAHAKHWSELKGFALSLQFNPGGRLTDEQFAELHQHIGVAPVLPGQNGANEYAAGLRQARSLIQDSFGFADDNMGDDHGAGGW